MCMSMQSFKIGLKEQPDPSLIRPELSLKLQAEYENLYVM